MLGSRIRVAAVAILTIGALASVALVASLAGTAAASPSAAAARAKGTRINLRGSNRGKILVTGNGFTVYVFGADKKRKDNCVKKSGCTDTWPLVTTKAKPRAGKGVKGSLLGT